MEKTVSLDLSGLEKAIRQNTSDEAFWEEHDEYASVLKHALKRLNSGEEPFTGWVDLPNRYRKEEIQQIQDTAAQVQQKCDAFVIIGVGGSYLGARAAIEALAVPHWMKRDCDTTMPRIYYAGYNFSGAYHKALIHELNEKDICFCVISKSGTTTESCAAYALMKDLMVRRYGAAEAKKRIYIVTDKHQGIFRREAEENGYQSFAVSENTGGRYSVLSSVGLFPIAVAGVDIQELLAGAAHMASREQYELGQAAKLAVCRYLLHKQGKRVEVFEAYEPGLNYFVEWLKQLFGESEGKQGKGIFPAGLQFSADLHSMGQFLQDGNPIFFETVLNILEPEEDLAVPEVVDSLCAGRTYNELNQAAFRGVTRAHKKAEIPMIRLDIPRLTPYHFGEMIYLFEIACALSGYLFGVNPFDQPGVEAYKLEMRKALTK